MSIPLQAPSAGSRWIISRRQDLLWFQGSVLAGLALWAFFQLGPRLDDATYKAGHPAVIALLLWGVFFDGTHVFGTYARSYLAPDAASRAALPGGWSFILVALGPAMAVADHALFTPTASQLGGGGALFRAFLFGAYLWAYFHLVRQHYGFVVLYRKRDPGTATLVRGVNLDAILLWAGCLYPYARFSLTDGYLRSGLPVTLPLSAMAPLRGALDALFGVGLLALLAALGLRRPQLGPKHLFLALVIGFHVLVFATLDNLLTITATLTIFHNLQYHRIVWQYERGQDRVPGGGLRPYLMWGVGLGLVWYGPRVMGTAITSSDLVRNSLLGLGWGVAFHHYLVDGKIWRIRRNTDVARTLDAGARAAKTR